MSKQLGWLILLLPALATAQSWVARYDGTGSVDKAAAMAVDYAGNIIVTGFSTGTGSGHDYLTVKYNPQGETLWTRRYSSSGNAPDEACAVAVDAAGNVYVTGQSRQGNHEVALTIKYSSTGLQQWVCPVAGFGADSNAAARAIALDANGNVYICGYAQDSTGGTNYLVAKLTGTGTVAYVARYDGPANGADTAHALTADAAGNVYVTGSSAGAGTGLDFATIKFDAHGDTVWVARYNGPGNANDIARALVLDGSGNLLVAGQSWGSGTVFDYATIKYLPAGDTAWVRRYNHTPTNGVDIPYALTVDAADNVYVTGSSESNRYEDYATIKYSSAGIQRWVSRYNGSTNGVDEAKAVVVDAAGNVYVTGYSESGNDYDVFTVQYDSSGTARWSHRYNTTPANDDDQGVAIAVPLSGLTYVTGFSFTGTPNYDYLTLKYVAHDVGVVSCNYPTGTMPPQPVVPEVTIRNYGIFAENLAVHLWIAVSGQAPSYYDVQTVSGLAAGDAKDISFRSFTGGVGEYVMRCSIALTGDLNRANDTLSRTFTFRWTTMPYWSEKPPVPLGPSGKFIKDGAALTFGRITDGGGQAVYALKGNNTIEFNRYSINGDSWQRLESLPYTWTARKRVKKGGALCYNRYDTTVFATKGNNTQEFWKYGVKARAWYLLPDVPLGTSLKKVKGGAGLAFWRQAADEEWVFLQKGGKTNELWGYHIPTQMWWSKAQIPYGPSGKGMGDGSCIVNAGGVLYLLKGGYNEFYAYYPAGDSYQAKKPLPFYGAAGRKKRAKDGSALSYDTDRRAIYCLKGGTDEFWAYYPGADTWVQQTSIPLGLSGKCVKSGGALTFGNHYAWALKGNKTLEFWQYYHGDDDDLGAEEPEDAENVVQHVIRNRSGWQLTVAPNPVTDRALIQYQLPEAGYAALKLYTVDGRRLATIGQGYHPAGRFVYAVSDLPRLSPGVYLLRLEGSPGILTHKLTVP